MTNPPRRSRPKKPGETIDSTAERIGTTPIVPETADAPGQDGLGQDGRDETLADPEARLADEASAAPTEPVAAEGELVRDDRPEEAAFPAEETLPERREEETEAVPSAATDAPPFETAGVPAEAGHDPLDGAERRDTAEAEFASAEGLDPARKPDEAREELDAETILAAAEPHHAEPPRPNLDYHETPQHGHNNGPGAGAMVGSALLGAALALLGGGLLQYAGVIPAVRQTDMQQLTQQFARQGDVQQVSTDLGTVRTDVEQLKSTLSAGGVGSGGPASADLAALTDRVGAVEGRLNNGGGGQGNAAPAIDPNLVRGATETADAARQAADAARQVADGAQQAANGAQSRANEANQTATTAQQAAGTAQQAAEVAQNAAKGAMDAANANREAIADIQSRIGSVEAANREAAVAISAAGLKAAVDRGGPFMSELESYATAAGASPVVDALRNYAPQGVPTPAELQAAWPDTRTAMLKALNPQDPNATVGSQILSGLSGLVAVRPSGQAASGGGEGPNAAIARLDAAVSAGNLAGWNAEWQKLPQAAKDASADFQRQVNARAETQRVLGDALGQVVNSIGKAG